MQNGEQMNEIEKALKLLIETIEAHDVDSLSCDRDGNHYCDCLELALEEAKKALKHLKYNERKT